MGDEYENPEQLKELLSVVSTEIPKLIESITKTMYNTDNAQNVAKAVAEFYKTMKAAGMNDKQAYDLTEEFMGSFSLGGIISNAIKSGSGDDDLDGLEDEIERMVQEKVEKKFKKKSGEEREDDD